MKGKFEAAAIRGVGIGLRAEHYDHIVENRPDVPWFEALTDNYLSSAGRHLRYLERIREDYPVTLHSVGMSLGSTDAFNMDYLSRIKQLAERLQPAFVSDHLAWTSVEGKYLNDLMPFPYTEETLIHMAERIRRVQDYFGRRILVENPSNCLSFRFSTMSEAEFIREVATQADCYLLVDVNNVYVSAMNSGFNALEFLGALPAERVKQFHLAGYEDRSDYLFDTHGYPVHDPVWRLYETALERFGPVPTLIEWDTDIPVFEVLMAEAHKAEECLREVE